MTTPTAAAQLQARIDKLTLQQKEELQDLKDHLHSTLEELNPLYILKKMVWGTSSQKSRLTQAASLTLPLVFGNPLASMLQKPLMNVARRLLLSVLNTLSPKKTQPSEKQ
jgi:hypothetical protein